MVVCEICGKLFSSKGIGTHKWRVHGEGVNFNPNSGYVEGTRTAWNKGLTKENSESVRSSSEKLKRHRSQLEEFLDDDGKLHQRFENKRVNAKAEGIECQLSYEDYMLLVTDAKLVSSQLGFTGEGYVLGRYNDSGPYSIDNCRFITQKENSDEKNRRLKDK